MIYTKKSELVMSSYEFYLIERFFEIYMKILTFILIKKTIINIR